MTVSELIEELMQSDPDAEVVREAICATNIKRDIIRQTQSARPTTVNLYRTAEQRADAVRVAANRQVMQNGQWTDAPVQAATVQKIEDIILIECAICAGRVSLARVFIS